ncbi:MAG: aminotransferase class V-fold PLP-dependent enzyme [Fuerstiella sp.]|nr:aminotransferase class V-fold PLP-dependent enzyme [Fuerstiella sp.]
MNDIDIRPLPVDDDAAWQPWRDQWPIRSGTIYLNHGSFGPTPRPIRECQLNWQQRLASQPMDFFVREYEPAWLDARRRLADFLDTAPDSLVFVENATAAMNVAASTFELQPDQDVLLTDHEYGAVFRIWQRVCEQTPGATLTTARLPLSFESAHQVVDYIFRAATQRTRLLVVSHITSPTAVILPIKLICEEAERRGIAVCVDGPHAPGQIPVSPDSLSCDFYAASLHKWVSAPFGSGFLYVAPEWHERVRTPSLSWGRIAPATPTTWWEEFVWTGTRDSSAYLATPAALDLLEHQVGLSAFRARTHFLARYARQQIIELTGLEPFIPDSEQWYGSMISLPLPPGDARSLQEQLWEQYRIEVPVVEHNGRRSVRVSCHLYNRCEDIDFLIQCLKSLLQHAC